MADQQVFVAMRRTDIPDSVLQLTELKPNDSQRNYIYDPPGQTQYVKNLPTNSVVATTGAGPITTNAAYTGLAAYLIDTVEDSSGTALVAAVANATSDDIVVAVTSGAGLSEAIIDALLVANGATAGTGLSVGTSIASLTDILGIVAGRNYLVPGGATIEDGGNLFIPTARGSFTNNGEYKQLYETGDFKISNGIGQIANFKDAGFSYLGTTGPALTVYAEDGTLL